MKRDKADQPKSKRRYPRRGASERDQLPEAGQTARYQPWDHSQHYTGQEKAAFQPRRHRFPALAPILLRRVPRYRTLLPLPSVLREGHGKIKMKQSRPDCRYVKMGSTFAPLVIVVRDLVEQGFEPQELTERIGRLIEVIYGDLQRKRKKKTPSPTRSLQNGTNKSLDGRRAGGVKSRL